MSPGAGQIGLAQRLGSLLWAAFLGAVCNFAVLLALPAAWFEHDAGLGPLSLLFFLSWALALVPALAAVMLAMPPQGTRE